VDLSISKPNVRNIEIYGTRYEVRKPKVWEIEKVALESEKLDDSKKIDYLKDFIENLGVPKDQLNDMEVEDFSKLCDYFMASKKK